MHVYGRTPAELVKGVFYSLGGGLVGLVIAGAAGWPLWARVALPLALILAVGLLLVAGEAMRVEVDEAGTLSVYQLGRLRHQFSLADCQLTLSPKKDRRNLLSPPDRSILIFPNSGGKALRLDCSPLGKEQFTQLCQVLRAHGAE